MPSKHMLPKGKRRKSVRAEYREQRTLAEERAEADRKRAEDELFARRGEPAEESTDALIDTRDMIAREPTLEERVAANDWITRRVTPGSRNAEDDDDAPRYANPYATVRRDKPAPRAIQPVQVEVDGETRTLTVQADARDMRLDTYLAKALAEVSRGRVQQLIEGGHVLVDGKAVKASYKLAGGERITIEGEAKRAPLRAEAEDIPLDVIYEDDDLAVINKPAGMMVHAGAGSGEHNRGTLVNALLFRYGQSLSRGGVDVETESEAVEAPDEIVTSDAEQPRPGIVHRLDKQTSGLIVIARKDSAHRRLAESFAERRVKKTYLALVQGWPAQDEGTVDLAIGRDATRRTRMTTKRNGLGMRHAVSHWKVRERVDGPYGRFALLEVTIETGRTHQIRVHLAAIGHPVVGDTLYGAAAMVKPPVLAKGRSPKAAARVEADSTVEPFKLERNFLHAAKLSFAHPRTGKDLALAAGLPEELERVLDRLRGAGEARAAKRTKSPEAKKSAGSAS